MTQETKVCSKCFKEKPIDSFRWLNTQGRYHAWCKDCEREYVRKYNKSITADKRAEYAITHKIKQMSAIKVLDLLTQQKDIYMTQLKTLQTNIEQWITDRDLHTGDPSRQILKLLEEQGELAAAMARNNRDEMVDAVGDITVVALVIAKQLNASVDLWETFKMYTENDGDKLDEPLAVAVLAGNIAHLAKILCFSKTEPMNTHITLVIVRAISIARTLDVDFIAAVQSAYDTIKDRKGKLVNGVFVKENE